MLHFIILAIAYALLSNCASITPTKTPTFDDPTFSSSQPTRYPTIANQLTLIPSWNPSFMISDKPTLIPTYKTTLFPSLQMNPSLTPSDNHALIQNSTPSFVPSNESTFYPSFDDSITSSSTMNVTRMKSEINIKEDGEWALSVLLTWIGITVSLAIIVLCLIILIVCLTKHKKRLEKENGKYNNDNNRKNTEILPTLANLRHFGKINSTSMTPVSFVDSNCKDECDINIECELEADFSENGQIATPTPFNDDLNSNINDGDGDNNETKKKKIIIIILMIIILMMMILLIH